MAYGPTESWLTSFAFSQSIDWTSAIGCQYKILTAGRITALKFYRHTSTTGTTRQFRLYVNSVLAASANSSGESGSGWVTATLATPVNVAPNDVIHSYHDNVGMMTYASGLVTLTTPNAQFQGSKATAVGQGPGTGNYSDTWSADVVFQPGTADASGGGDLTIHDYARTYYSKEAIKLGVTQAQADKLSIDDLMRVYFGDQAKILAPPMTQAEVDKASLSDLAYKFYKAKSVA